MYEISFNASHAIILGKTSSNRMQPSSNLNYGRNVETLVFAMRTPVLKPSRYGLRPWTNLAKTLVDDGDTDDAMSIK